MCKANFENDVFDEIHFTEEEIALSKTVLSDSAGLFFDNAGGPGQLYAAVDNLRAAFRTEYPDLEVTVTTDLPDLH